MNDDFFRIPPIKPNETVYSWISRFHRFTANSLAASTFQILFGNAIQAFKHDIPSNIALLSKNTNLQLGSTETLLFQHTAFKQHLPFLNSQFKQQIIDYLVKTQGSSKARGMLALNKYPAKLLNTLKYCPECVREQRKNHSFGYWLLDQQAASSFYCLQHDTPLNIIPIHTYRGHTNQLLLPGDQILPISHPIEDSKAAQHFRKITVYGDLIAKLKLTLDQKSLRWCYLYQAQQLKMVSMDGNARTRKLGDKFVAYYGDVFLSFFGRELLGDLRDANAGFISSLLRNGPGYRHPIKHILFINFMFHSMNEFEQTLERVNLDLMMGGDELCNRQIQLNRSRLIDRVSSGASINSLSKELDTNNSSAISFLDSLNIERNRRPRIQGTDKERKLFTLLWDGATRSEIYEDLNIKPSFLNCYLNKHIDLKNEWLAKCHKRNISNHRDRLIEILASHTGINIKRLKTIPGNGYQWLMKHDREWLLQNLPSLWAAKNLE